MTDTKVLTRQDVIETTLVESYGKSDMSSRLARDLNFAWDNFKDDEEHSEGESRFSLHYRVQMKIWDFFSGGDTADFTAGKVVAAVAAFEGKA